MDGVPKIIDSDVHFFEDRRTWLDRIEPRFRDRALQIVDDERGFAWLACGDRRLHLAEVHVPGRVDLLGEGRKREREWNGQRPAPFEEQVRPEFRDPAARLARMDAEGVDAAIFFPNYGLLWEDLLADDVEATCANMAAYNTWVTEIARASGSRLFGVSHLSLRDAAWAENEIGRMATAGIRLAMIGPNPVDGKPLAHPDLDRLWACFQDHEVAPVFHVSLFQRPLHPAWYEMDPDPVNKVMDMVFLSVAPAAAITNLIIHGKLEQFPRLRLGVMELTGRWVPEYLLHLDGGFAFYRTMNARPLTHLSLQPSDYFRRQVRIGVFGAEGPLQLIEQVGDRIFMWCSDYPHAEGLASGLSDYRGMTTGIEEGAAARLFGGNAAWLLFGGG
jgi:predicted TIM-barrel fold metal-dependent hydrolase